MARLPVKLLPAIHQTDDNKDLFAATVDHLFSSGRSEQVSGYIGHVPSYNNVAYDFYKAEPTDERQEYQLESMMISRDDTGTVTHSLFYDDLLQKLSNLGANTSDQNRLFSSGYYSWAPPVDIDKLTNFANYYWSGVDAAYTPLMLPGIEIPSDYDGDGETREFALPVSLPNRYVLPADQIMYQGNVFDGCPVALVNGLPVDCQIVDKNTVGLDVTPEIGDVISIYRYGNIGDGARVDFPIPTAFDSSLTSVYVFVNGVPVSNFTKTGQKITFTVAPDEGAIVTVLNTLSIATYLTGKANPDISSLNTAGLTNLLNGQRIGVIDATTAFVGLGIKPLDTYAWDEELNKYFLVENVYSGISLYSDSDSIIAQDAVYVVIDRSSIDQSYWSRVNRWVHRDSVQGDIDPSLRATRPIIEFRAGIQQYNYGRTRVQNVTGTVFAAPTVGGQPIDFASIAGRVGGSVTVDNGYVLTNGDFVLVTLNGDNKIYSITYDNTGKYLVAVVVVPMVGAITAVNDDVEYWYNGAQWKQASTRGNYPVFDLFDQNGHSLSDSTVYPDSDFDGSLLFGYQVGTGTNDTILDQPMVYDDNGQIVFENYLFTDRFHNGNDEIIGYYYYREGNKLNNQWYLSPNQTKNITPSTPFRVPQALQANPDYDVVKYISKSQWFEHFSSIMTNQIGFTGQPFSANNWAETARDLSLGTEIIQTQSPMLRLMLMMSDPNFDLKNAMAFTEIEYIRFKLKFRQKISVMTQSGAISPSMSMDKILSTILTSLKQAKSAQFPYYISTVGGGKFFIPPTPSVMGIHHLYTPQIVTVSVFGVPQSYLLCHDGSQTALIDTFTDSINLAMETAIYNAAFARDSELIDDFDLTDCVSGKFRQSSYSRDEFNAIAQPGFEDWVRQNQADYQSNESFNPADPFSWNYSAISDRDGDPIPGNYKGIYRYYFDTENPAQTPWEMLGFRERPSWWVGQYGPGPYTKTNTALWSDLEAGYIQQGSRQGYDARFARPGLMNVLPVDAYGTLLDPVTARIVPSAPPIQFASQNWSFGDCSPLEALWYKSSSYGFARAYQRYLLMPGRFIETYFDYGNRSFINGQLINTETKDRPRSVEYIVHGETLSDGSIKEGNGIQTWLVEYLINKGQQPSVLGDAIRGLEVRLGHKMAAFTTKDRMTVSSESFGLVPDDDIIIKQYVSSGASVYYSGILIEYYAPSRWRVLGYNQTDPYFDILVGDPNGRKISLNPNNQRAITPWNRNVYYKVGMLVTYQGTTYECAANHTSSASFESQYWTVSTIAPTVNFTKMLDTTGQTARIPYTTQFNTRQSVVDFIYAYEQFLLQEGFTFEENTWDEAVQNFIDWSKADWKLGNFIAVSPGARTLNFHTDIGYIDNFRGPASKGTLVNRVGYIINQDNVRYDRNAGDLSIMVANEEIYGAPLVISEAEHVLIFSNSTIFNDLIYDPLLNIRQERLKLSARRATDWNGRLHAPGFVINDTSIVSNFEKAATDISDMFDIELADNTVLRDRARAQIGFLKKDYFDQLLINETEQFELYQGMIKSKGTADAARAILRSRMLDQNKDVEFIEEWGFKSGEYGAYHTDALLAFSLFQSDMRRQQQIIHFGATQQTDWVTVTPNDSRWMSNAGNFSSMVTQAPYAYQDAGFIRNTEASQAYPSFQAFTDAATAQIASGVPYTASDIIWLYRNENRTDQSWDALAFVDFGAVTNVENNDDDDTVVGTRIFISGGFQVGDWIVVNGPVSDDYSLSTIWQVANTGTGWIEIDGSIDNGFDFTTYPNENPPHILKLISLHLPSVSSATPQHYPFNIYVDNNGNGVWGVFSRISSAWVMKRSQPQVIDNTKIKQSLLFDLSTKTTSNSISPQALLLDHMTVIDPLYGMLSGEAMQDIDYCIEVDPADYTGVETQWMSDQIGTLWWDTSTAFFTNYYTDDLTGLSDTSQRYIDEINYRATNWGSIASGSSVDVYEWTRTITDPSTMDDSDLYSGQYVTNAEYNSVLDKVETVYYLWIKNPAVLPTGSEIAFNRKTSAADCSDLIANPTSLDMPWMAVMSPNDIVVSGVRDYLDDDSSVMETKIKIINDDIVGHKEWQLVQKDNPYSKPNKALWKKMIDSLVGSNSSLMPIPSPTLNANYQTGSGFNQSMFNSEYFYAARQSLINNLNYKFIGVDDSLPNLYSILNMADAPPALHLYSPTFTNQTIFVPPATEYDIVVYSYDDVVSHLTTYPTHRVMLDNRMSDNPSISIWYFHSGSVVLYPAYDVSVASSAQLSTVTITNGLRVLNLNNSDYRGFWTISQYNNGSPTVINAQKYRTSDFIELVDWYDDNFANAIPPVVEYDTVNDRNVAENPSPTHLLVKVNLESGWIWTAYQDGSWQTVARQNGAFQFSEQFYTGTTRYGFNTSTGGYRFAASDVRNRDGSYELRVLLEALVLNNILSDSDINDVWFSLVHFALSTHDQVDWLFKTSFMSIVNFNELIQQYPVSTPDTTDFITQYLDDINPYRVKLRDFTRILTPDSEEVPLNLTDFDKPVYFDPAIGNYRVLNDNDAGDQAIMNSTVPYTNYMEHQDKVRNIHTILSFDRISHTSGGAIDRMLAANPSVDPTIMDYNGKPQEYFGLQAMDLDLMRGTDRSGIGAPSHSYGHFDVSAVSGSTTTLTLPHVVSRSVAVFFDGVRVYSGYTMDYLAGTITVSLVKADNSRVTSVAVEEFGFSALQRIISQQYFVGDGTTKTIAITSDETTEVTQNGVTVATTTNNGLMSFPMTNGLDYIATTYDNAGTPITAMKVTQLDATKTSWTLANVPSSYPYAAGVIVEKNGLRLAPPTYIYSSGQNSIFVGENYSASQLEVIVDQRASQVFPATGNTIEEVIAANMSTHRFVLWNEYIVVCQTTFDNTVFTVHLKSTGDYDVDHSGNLTITAPYAGSDTLMVTQFINDDAMDIRTMSYDHDLDGTYRFNAADDYAGVWVTRGGKYLIGGVDYTVVTKGSSNWNDETFGSFEFGDNVIYQYVVMSDPTITGPVVVTLFNGYAAVRPSGWNVFTLNTNSVRVPSDWGYDTFDPIFDVGYLVQPVLPTTSNIVVNISINSLPAKMIRNSSFQLVNGAGYIWIDNERIKFTTRTVDQTGTYVTLGGIIRGINSTFAENHLAGSQVMYSNAATAVPPVPQASGGSTGNGGGLDFSDPSNSINAGNM